MLRRYTNLFLLVFSAAAAAAVAEVACPYDLAAAARMVPPECYANATRHSATSCCWFVFGGYIYAAARHANATGDAFLPPTKAAACASAFSARLLGGGLVRRALLASNSSCSLTSPIALAAAGGPCQFPTVSAVRSAVNLSLAVRSCAASPRLNLDANESACTDCQNDVIAATFALLNASNSKEFVACGMATTLGIWAGFSPTLDRFRSYVLCLVQVLENINGLSTGFLLPSPPPPPPSPPSPPSRSSSHSRTVKIAAASAAATLTSAVVIICFILFAVRRKDENFKAAGGERAARKSPLPTEGLYIFTRSELKQATNSYDAKLLLGEGGAGKVFLGTLPSGQRVAIKRIYREKKLDEFYKEVEILAKLRHKNLTTLLGYCLEDSEHVLVYEYMAGGNLSAALFHGELSWRRRLGIAADVAEGLVYLHGLPEGAVVHRDVKPTNVLLGEGRLAAAKLSDFGVSRVVPGEAAHVTTEVRGTMGYVDPESFAVGHVSEATDVYSFGVVLLELVTGLRAVVPTPSGGAESLVIAANAAAAPVVDPQLTDQWDRASAADVFATAIRCVGPNKGQRPRMSEVLLVLRHAIADLEARSGDVASSPPCTDAGYTSVEPFSTQVTSNEGSSTPSIQAWSL